MALSFSSAAAKWSNNLGHYVATGEEQEGAPVYRNSHDRYLYRHSDGTWRADYRIGDYGVYKSVDNAECPASISQWQYWGDGWHSGDITAQCN